jgi:hypothetical protein
MNARRISLANCAVIAVSALAMSCGVSASFLSDSEKSSLYSVSVVSKSGEEIRNGSMLSPGAVLVPSVSILPGAADPSGFEIVLEGSLGAAAALRIVPRDQISAVSESASGDTEVPPAAADTIQTEQSVERITGELPGLSIPDSIPAGAYKVEMCVLDQTGAKYLTSIVIFIGFDEPYVENARLFPPSVEPGAPVLLDVSIGFSSKAAAQAETITVSECNPWIEWSVGGSIFAAGPLASGFDRTVWLVPKAAGAYTVTVQVYPEPPLKGRSFGFPASTAARKDIPVVAKQPPAGSGDDFADALSFLSLLRLDGDFSDVGTRPRTGQPESFGSPRLDLYSSGFGYRFTASSGVRVPGLMPPARGDRLVPFSVLVRFSPEDEDGTGTIVRFRSDDGGYSLILGLDAWRPYAEFSFEGKIQRSTAASALPYIPLTLEAVFKPSGTTLGISWTAEGERIRAPSMPLPPPPPTGSAELGGSGSLVGIYDGFGLSSGPPSPAFKLAARRKWKSSLILAESFEDGRIPASIVVSGPVSAAQASLELGPGAALAFPSTFDLGEGVVIESAMTGDRASGRLVLAGPDGSGVVSIRGTGEIEDASGRVLGSVMEAGAGRLSLTLTVSASALVVTSAGGSAVHVPMNGADSDSFSLVVRRERGVGSFALTNIIVRRSNQSLGT